MTDQTAKIAALQTLNARLLQENLRLTKDNEELRARLSTRSNQGSPASTRDVRTGNILPDLVEIARQTMDDGVHRRAAPRPPSNSSSAPEGRGVVHVPDGVPLFDRPPAERRFLVGEARTRETGARGTRADSSSQASLRRIVAGGVPVRRTPLPTSTPAIPISGRGDAATQPQPQDRTRIRPPDDPRPRAHGQDDDARRNPAATPEDDACARFSLLELD